MTHFVPIKITYLPTFRITTDDCRDVNFRLLPDAVACTAGVVKQFRLRIFLTFATYNRYNYADNCGTAYWLGAGHG